MALTLTRRPGEKILIGDLISIKVTSVEGDKVRLSIDALRAIRVDRSEVRAAIEAAKQEDGK